jgi:hypothetical protein
MLPGGCAGAETVAVPVQTVWTGRVRAGNYGVDWARLSVHDVELVALW